MTLGVASVTICRGYNLYWKLTMEGPKGRSMGSPIPTALGMAQVAQVAQSPEPLGPCEPSGPSGSKFSRALVLLGLLLACLVLACLSRQDPDCNSLAS